jgi:hypothetical protein
VFCIAIMSNGGGTVHSKPSVRVWLNPVAKPENAEQHASDKPQEFDRTL